MAGFKSSIHCIAQKVKALKRRIQNLEVKTQHIMAFPSWNDSISNGTTIESFVGDKTLTTCGTTSFNAQFAVNGNENNGNVAGVNLTVTGKSLTCDDILVETLDTETTTAAFVQDSVIIASFHNVIVGDNETETLNFAVVMVPEAVKVIQPEGSFIVNSNKLGFFTESLGVSQQSMSGAFTTEEKLDAVILALTNYGLLADLSRDIKTTTKDYSEILKAMKKQ